MLWQKKRRSALFVDFDNLVPVYGMALVESVANWTRWIEDGRYDPSGRGRNLVVKRVFWNTENDTHNLSFKKHRFQTFPCRAIRKEKASSADFDITIQAVELRHARRDIDEFIILSFDADFSSVLSHLQAYDFEGTAMYDDAQLQEALKSKRENATSKFRRILGYTIEKEAFRAALKYERPRRPWWRLLSRAARAPGETLEATRIEEAPATPLLPAPETGATALPLPAARAASPTRPRRPRRRGRGATQKRVFDLAEAATRIVAEMEETDSNVISRERVKRVLQPIEGFDDDGSQPWLGCGTYRNMLRQLAAKSGARLLIKEVASGGILLTLARRSPGAAPSA